MSRRSTTNSRNNGQTVTISRSNRIVLLAALSLILGAAFTIPLEDGAIGGTLAGALPCPFTKATSIECPMCGMTTSVVHSGHGDFAEAARINPMGVFFYLYVWLLFLATLASFWLPRIDLNRFTHPKVVAILIVVGLAAWPLRLLFLR